MSNSLNVTFHVEIHIDVKVPARISAGPQAETLSMNQSIENNAQKLNQQKISEERSNAENIKQEKQNLIENKLRDENQVFKKIIMVDKMTSTSATKNFEDKVITTDKKIENIEENKKSTVNQILNEANVINVDKLPHDGGVQVTETHTNNDGLSVPSNVSTTATDSSFVSCQEFIMPAIRPLVPELAEVAQQTLNETETNVTQDLNDLKKWIDDQPHLKARMDDQFLLAFIRFCKHDLEETKKRIDFFYTYKSTAGDLLPSRRLDDKLLELSTSGIITYLPKPMGPGGPRIHFTRVGLIDTSKYSVKDIFRFHMFRSEVEINTDDNWVISGVIEIIDCSRIPFALLRQFEPSLFKKMSAYLEYGIPTNLIGTHIINASRETQLILHLVRQCMKQKELLSIHSSLDSLEKAIGKEYLPVELGGNNGTFEESIQNFDTLLRSFEQYFIDDEAYGVDEKLRPVTSNKTPSKPSLPKSPKAQKAATDNDASFRQLAID